MSESENFEIRIRPHAAWFYLDWRGLLDYRDLLFLMVRRDFVSKYRQTVLGPLWALITPIVTSLVFTFVFAKALAVKTDGVPPILFYLCGLQGWNYFNQTLSATSNALLGNYQLFSKVYFPRLVVPFAIAASNLVGATIQCATFAGSYVYLFLTNPEIAARPTWGALLLPLIFLHLAFLALGSGLLLSAVTAKYRDFQQVAPFVIGQMMYVTPVIYPMSGIPERWQWLAAINPVAPVLETLRSILLGTPGVTFATYAWSLGFTAVVFVLGVGVYQRMSRTFVDYA